MADALHMFLMAASPLQLGGSLAAKASDLETSSPTEAQPFAMQLAEAGEQPLILTERQKAAAGTSLTDTVPAEAVNSEALQAILTDEQSTADEKDAARAWLAIIRAGQQEKAGITLVAVSSKPDGLAGKESLDAKSELLQQLRATLEQAASEQQNTQEEDAQEAVLKKAGSQLGEPGAASAAPKVRSGLISETGGVAAADAKSSPESLITSENASNEREADAAADILVTEKAVKTAEASKLTAETAAPAMKADAKTSSADSLLVNTISNKIDATADELTKSDATDSLPDAKTTLTGKAASVAEQAIAEGMAKSLTSGELLVSTQRKAPTNDSSGESKPEPNSLETDSILQLLQQEGDKGTATPLQPSGVFSDNISPMQTLAAAVQARADAQIKVAQAATPSGEQKSGEQKEQSMANTMLSAMQQAQSEQSKAAAERFDATPEPEHVLSEEFQQRALNSQSVSSLVGAGQSSASSALATAASTAQVIQSQGSAAVQPASPSPTVSELLRQPLNLLAADASGQLRERLVMMVRNSVHSAEIKLDPAELGSMHIRVSMQQDQASVQFFVQQAHAKEILEEQLPKLRDMLGEQGIELADGQVSQQQPGQQQQQQTAGGNGMNEDDTSAMQEQRLPVAKPSNRLVDYYA
ncbi:flagellar hook-length control protein FliK [Alkalimonas sp. MEB108]|uniref:Flagellar hook-length control protein FliK n=1 Tax=Alkalimonas cellulosilytica TaxID=3058395 RepID=A0ABU7J190_9GAMM|nr:flagellar hook-length control protein FliK [Alkalimonas sp. MEB108]MEE2000045.1 flagellar hook-length control protein FliK [Alkalimonas sp. MEB108]